MYRDWIVEIQGSSSSNHHLHAFQREERSEWRLQSVDQSVVICGGICLDSNPLAFNNKVLPKSSVDWNACTKNNTQSQQLEDSRVAVQAIIRFSSPPHQ